jgi:hypothetical protein
LLHFLQALVLARCFGRLRGHQHARLRLGR